ncbi:MAG TPA: TOBE domain-containing protein [Gammaproteobacteria bacterium]|jgi:molybdopterin-binding protein|nr:TOBE domain-containing protein [Gammaproteobacteria bacterium]
MTITVNTRNQFRGTVVRINDGPIVSEVELETQAGIITAVVTSSSIRSVGLRVGDEAVALFKATEVLIGKL